MADQMVSPIAQLLQKRILVIDGAMGTSLQAMDLVDEDFGGEAYAGCNEYLSITKPEAIVAVHESYLRSGADIIETNTFGATSVVLAEYNLHHLTDQLNKASVVLAKEACKRYSTPEKPRFVAGSMGPTTKSLSVTGGISFDELAHTFFEQAISLIEGGVDYLLLETALDTLNLKAGYIGILKAFKQIGCQIPIAISGTIETMGSMLAGQGVEALYTSMAHINPLYIGLNCATGPIFMKDHIRTLSQIAQCPVAVVPNAGIPNPDGSYPESPTDMATVLEEFAHQGWINILGGCCGTTPAHIEKMVSIAHLHPPRTIPSHHSTTLSGIDALTIESENRPYLVGERTNVIGSRAFKALITEEKFEEAAEIARKQVRSGAHLLDVCLSNPDRDEDQDMVQFLSFATKLVKVPFMIDSQVPKVVETAFKLTQGKCILNSINLEDGEKSFEELLPLVATYGAGVVVGCIANEMAVTAMQKLEVARRAHQLLTQKYGIQEEDIYFDPLVFPCGTGDEKYIGSGKETIEGVRLIKENFPLCKTVLGISNVSFGLPHAGREVLNSVFLYHCTKAGLDLALVNTEKLMRYATISEEERQLCNDLLWYRTENGYDPIAHFASFYRNKKSTVVQEDLSHLSVEKRIEHNIVGGTKEGLLTNLEEALQQWSPLEVVNNPLMRAMDIVGKMFNDNELIVAEVLQSAEVMKASVAYLEQKMEKSEVHTRGTLLLATVKGDVHDIGKNLVEIILSNNGYRVIDLGIKCPPQTIIEAVATHQPDFIGLSGLLVKSAQQMVITAQDLRAQGIDIPILVGGAALTENFTRTRIAIEYNGPVVYCKDAMSGLSVANQLSDPQKRDLFLSNHRQEGIDFSSTSSSPERGESKRIFKEKLTFQYDPIRAKMPHPDPVIFTPPLEEVWELINPQMLYGNHLGLKGNIESLSKKNDPKYLKIHTLMTSLKERILKENLLTAKGIYQFFKVRKDGDALVILDPITLQETHRFVFPRQSEGLNLCLTDFIHPDQIDSLAAFVVTCGDGVSVIAKELMDQGNYFESHGLSALALESAEACAEWIHQELRTIWGIPDDKKLSRDDLFKLKYTGIRVSFGYPACPRLEDQRILFDLLQPEAKIGLSLSEEYMMYPEASVSGLVFHHPQARYFTINEGDLKAFESIHASELSKDR